MKMSLKKGGLLTIAIALIVLSVVMIIPIYQYYQPAKARPIYHIQANHCDDTIRVLFIGDSWAAYHQEYDNHLAAMITSSTNKPCIVKSSGNVGAKSKEVYERLYSSTKPFIMDHPDYCIISAGINDAIAKMGVDYYTANYMNIIDFLLSQRIIPVIIDMPNVNYYAVYHRETLVAKLRHRLSAVFNGVDFYSFHPYRVALSDMLEKIGKHDSVIYVKTDKLTSGDIGPRLFIDDGIHLNNNGYLQLDSCLSTEIANQNSF